MTEYIELKAAKEAVHQIMEPWPNLEEDIYDLLDEIPSADVVERKRGEWIDPEDLICYKCTACGMYANQGYGLDEPIFWDYCPNCGADMRGREDD